MATINYNGMELEEITKPQIFDPPKKCVVFDSYYEKMSIIRNVVAILPASFNECGGSVITEENEKMQCANQKRVDICLAKYGVRECEDKKEYGRRYIKIYHQKHREKILAYMREYGKRHKKGIRAKKDYLFGGDK